jgi:hypothetical protein
MMTQFDTTNALITIGPMTAHELSLQLRLPSQDVTKAVAALKKARQVFVYAWDEGQPVYAAGYAKDAKQPPPPAPVDRTFNAKIAAKANPELGIWAGLAR